MNRALSFASREASFVKRLSSRHSDVRRFTLHPSRFTAFLVCIGLILALGPTEAAGPSLADRVIEHRLANGLTLLMVERHQSPIVSINMTFGVGGLDERTGMTGVAHLYEHMAFKGTRTIGAKNYEKERPLLDELDRLNDRIDRLQAELADAPADKADPAKTKELERLKQQFAQTQERASDLVVGNEMSLLYQRHGAVGLNASTGKDVTRYTVSLPANRLPLWAAIESDRMAHPVLREFYKERAVVMEERRLRTDDSPSGLLYEAFTAAAFQAHPYGFPTIGWASDIQSLTPTETDAFFRTYYGPGNAVIAIVGDINPNDTIALIERSFGSIPAVPPPPRVVTVEPAQRGERRVTIEFEAEPIVLVGYHKPSIGHPDDPVFDVLDAVLSEGVTSRLYKRLVRELKLAASVSTDASTPGVRSPNLFVISATPLAPHTTAELEGAINEELTRLKREPVSADELAKVINNLDAGLVRALRSNSGLASQLAYFHVVAKDWRYVLTSRDRIAAVSPADIQRVAARYFTPSNRTVATLTRK